MSNKPLILEISEAFPSLNNPTKGIFIKKHIENMIRYYDVLLIVPLRLIPPSRLFSYNIIKTIKNTLFWFYSINNIKNYKVQDRIYIKYLSLPRPYFEFINVYLHGLIFKKIIQRKRTIKPQIIYCHWGVSFSYLGKKLAQHFKVPFIIDVHEDIDNIRKIPLIMPYYKDMLKTCNRIIVHSIRTRNNIMKLGVNFEKITLVPLGVDEIFLDNNITEIRYKKKNENIKLITVANLENKCKRIDVLINAVKKLIDIGYSIQLTIVGDGILKNVLKKLADNLAIKDHVLFTGNLSSDQIKRLLLMNDIFIMPSNRESFGIALIEALALGLVVVASDNVGAVSDLELFGINLVVFKSDDIEELTEKIANIINNFNYYKQFIKGNSIITKRIYSWENHSKQICDLIDKEILIGRL